MDPNLCFVFPVNIKCQTDEDENNWICVGMRFITNIVDIESIGLHNFYFPMSALCYSKLQEVWHST